MLIETIDLSKSYSSDDVETLALDNVNLRIDEGEFVSIMGPSGCGKTTLLNLIGLLDTPTSGQLFFMGEEVGQASSKKRAMIRRSKIGFVFQSFNLIDELSIAENIELPLMYLQISPAERKRRVERIMERLQIAHKRNQYPNQVSGGQQQRAAVARAIVTQPKLILADEPTGNLDSARGREVMEMLVQLNELGTTILMVTHSNAATEYSNRVIHLFDGQVVTENII